MSQIEDINDIDVGDVISYNDINFVCVRTEKTTDDPWYTIIYTIKEDDYEKFKGKTLGINDPVFKILAYNHLQFFMVKNKSLSSRKLLFPYIETKVSSARNFCFP